MTERDATRRSPVQEALDAVEMLCDYAYEQGFHEIGYDPVEVLRNALQSETRENQTATVVQQVRAAEILSRTPSAVGDTRLRDAAHRAVVKMKAVYDRSHPDAPADECWAEVEALADALNEANRTESATRTTERVLKDAEEAINLFLEYRDKHGHSEESAKYAALNEFAEAESAATDRRTDG